MFLKLFVATSKFKDTLGLKLSSTFLREFFNGFHFCSKYHVSNRIMSESMNLASNLM